MKKYVKLGSSLMERLLFLFTGIIPESSITTRVSERRVPGGTYTKYPILPDVGPAPPMPECKPCAPDKPTPPPPPPMRIVREDIFAVSREEKMPDIPFFDLDKSETKSNI